MQLLATGAPSIAAFEALDQYGLATRLLPEWEPVPGESQTVPDPHRRPPRPTHGRGLALTSARSFRLAASTFGNCGLMSIRVWARTADTQIRANHL